MRAFAIHCDRTNNKKAQEISRTSNQDLEGIQLKLMDNTSFI